MSLISVVIPSYNHEKFIDLAVESVLSQSHADLELIVVDDGSKDHSVDYLRTVRDSRFRLIEQPNAGAHNAINRGLAMSRGDYIAILNSDDIFHPERLSVCLQRLQSGADLVATWLEVIDHKGRVMGVKEGWQNMLPWAITPPESQLAMSNAFAINLLQSNFVSTTSNIVFSRRLYESIGGMTNLRFVHDWDFLLRAVRSFRCDLIEKPLVKYRIHSSNTISSNRAWMLFEICWIYAVHTGLVLSSLLPAEDATKSLVADIRFWGDSINLQGNDKVMWMIQQLTDSLRRFGCEKPELELIENDILRKEFIRFICVS